jgi:hypothetical protein
MKRGEREGERDRRTYRACTHRHRRNHPHKTTSHQPGVSTHVCKADAWPRHTSSTTVGGVYLRDTSTGSNSGACTARIPPFTHAQRYPPLQPYLPSVHTCTAVRAYVRVRVCLCVWVCLRAVCRYVSVCMRASLCVSTNGWAHVPCGRAGWSAGGRVRPWSSSTQSQTCQCWSPCVL